jgi:hypothetical protein
VEPIDHIGSKPFVRSALVNQCSFGQVHARVRPEGPIKVAINSEGSSLPGVVIASNIAVHCMQDSSQSKTLIENPRRSE